MELLILIPSLLIFLYSLYKLAGDDHVFIRKNISLEQLFDTAFLTLFMGIIFSRLLYFIFNQPDKISELFILFFTAKGGFSLLGAVIGGIIGLYLISKYKRIPIGRIFDFFTICLLYALPVGFISMLLYIIRFPINIKDIDIPLIIGAVFYLLLALLFKLMLYPRLLSRSLREGNIFLIFLVIFSVVSFLVTAINFGKGTLPLLSIQNILYGILLLLSLILLLKQERTKLRRRGQ